MVYGLLQMQTTLAPQISPKSNSGSFLPSYLYFLIIKYQILIKMPAVQIKRKLNCIQPCIANIGERLAHARARNKVGRKV